MVTEHTHAKIEVKSQLAQKLQWKQTTGQTDTTDSSTLPEVGNQTDIYSAPMGERSIVMTVSICVSVCVCVCRDHISGNTRPIFTNFCACYLWPWLGPPLAALRHVMYFQLYG